MSLTTTNKQYFAGGYREVIADVAFDSSYPYGGESFTPGDVGMSAVHKLMIEPKGGYTFEYDYTNQKIKVFSPAPAIIYEEKHTAVGGLITLDYPAAWIVNVCQTGQHMAWGQSVAFASLAANTFCIVGTIADGTRTQIYTDGATDTVLVTYATQAWAELYKQLVQEEAVTLATGANDLANKMLAFGFCEAATSGILLPEDIADTTADGSVGIKPGFATGALDINVAQNTEVAAVTYLKEPASGFLTDRFVEDEDPTASGADPDVQTFNLPLLMWCISGYATATGAATQRFIEQNATPATTEINCNWGYRGADGTGAAPAAGFSLGCKDTVSITAGAYLFGHPWEIPGLALLEVKNATDLSSLSSVKVEMIGR